MNAKKWVTLSFLGTLLVITADEVWVQHETPHPSRYVGAVVAFTFLAFIAEAAPEFAGAFAILILIGMILTHTDAFKNIPVTGTSAQKPTTGGKKAA